MQKTTVVMPAFNEGSRILSVLESFTKLHDDVKKNLSIVVVDDGSSDNTVNAVSKLLTKQTFNIPLHVLRHKINIGKGAALKTGCDFAIKNGANIIIVMDADGQHLAADIPRFLDKITSGYDIVFGSRTIGSSMPLAMYLGNKALSISANILFHIYITDTQSGFRAFTADAYQKIRWKSTDYAVESEILVLAGKHNLQSADISIDTIYYDNHKGTTAFDGIKIFLNMLKWKFL